MGELQQMYDEVPPPSPVILAWGRSRLTTLVRDGGRRRAQVFEFLGYVPAVRVDEHATDALGRPAVALSLKSEGARLALLFDRSTYRYLGSHYVDLTPRPQGMDPTGEPDSEAGEEKVTILRVTVEDRLPTRS